jgi:hypothetical protein
MQTISECSLSASLPASDPIRTQSRILEVLIEAALDAGQDVRPRAQRADGWTPARIRSFLTVLAEWGVVSVAARAAGISRKSAYALRKSPKADAFAAAWETAMRLAHERRIDRRPSRVLHFTAKPVIRNGKVWGVRYQQDNRSAMATLARLDRAVGTGIQDLAALLETIGEGSSCQR